MIDRLIEEINFLCLYISWLDFFNQGAVHTWGRRKTQKKYNLVKLHGHTANSTSNVFSKVAAQKVLWSEENTYFKNCSILKLHSAFLCWNQKESVSRFFFLKMLGQTASLSAGLAALREISGLIYALSSFQSQHSNVKCELKIKG